MWDTCINDASLSQNGRQLETERVMWSKAVVDEFTLTQKCDALLHGERRLHRSATHG